jgi:hypothetical protein
VATFLSHDMSPERVVRAITGTDADASDIDPPDV